MLISARKSPILFLYLRVWDTSGELVPIVSWFNTDTMIASVPTKIKGAEAPVKVGRFEFIVTEARHETLLKEAIPEKFHDHIELVLEE